MRIIESNVKIHNYCNKSEYQQKMLMVVSCSSGWMYSFLSVEDTFDSACKKSTACVQGNPF